MSNSSANSNPPFVQRGFALPNYGINPSLLSGIPEHHGGSGGNGQGSPPPTASSSNLAGSGNFVIQNFRSWPEDPDNDDLANILRSLAREESSSKTHTNTNSTFTSSTNFDLRSPIYNFHGYQPASSSASPSQQQQPTPQNLSQSLPPNFLRQHSSAAVHTSQHVPQRQTGTEASMDVLHSPLGESGNFLFATLETGGYSHPQPQLRQHLHHGQTTAFSPSYLFDIGSPANEDQPSGIGPHKRPGSQSSSTASPLEEKMTGSTGRGRTSSTGKAPSARPSRSHQRRPSYTRTASPAGLRGATSPIATSHNLPLVSSSSNTSAASTSTSIPPPYVPGYPVASLNIQNNANHRYGSSVPTYLGHSSSSRPTTPSGMNASHRPLSIATNMNTSQQAFPHSPSYTHSHNRRQSDASTFAPSSYGESPLLGGIIPLPEEGPSAPPSGSETRLAKSEYGFAKVGSPSIMDDSKKGREEKP